MIDCFSISFIFKIMPNRKRKQTKLNKFVSAESSLIERIEKAVENLTYPSETDAEIHPFVGLFAAEVTKEEILRQTGHSADEFIEEKNFEEIFENLSKIQDWYGEDETATAAKFTNLKILLETNLKDLKFFKIGRREFDVYVVGLDSEGKLTGIKTVAVQT